MNILLFFSCSVKELTSFVEERAQGLSNKVADGDYSGLVNIMGHLMAIRDRQISSELHFKPLKSTAELLKTYGQQLPESVYTQLEVCTNTLRDTDALSHHGIIFVFIFSLKMKTNKGAA